MESLATKEVETSLGKIEVRSLTFDDFEKIGDAGANALTELAEFAGSDTQTPATVFMSARRAIQVGIRTILVLCSTLTEETIGTLPIRDIMRILNAWLEVSYWQEVSSLFFGVVAKIKTGVQNEKQT